MDRLGRLRAGAALGALAAATAGSAAAQTLASPAPASAAATVDSVVVTGRSLEDTLPEALSRTGVKVDVITDPAIRAGGYIDVAQALQALAPGLYVQPKNGPFDYVDVSLLGSRTADVLFLIDGVRINNRLYASTTPLDTVPAGVVERIEVLEGGQSLFYGTQAVAGAVNIVTRPFTDQRDGKLTVSGDTNGAVHGDGVFRDTVGKVPFVLYGSVDHSDGFHAFRDQDYQPSNTDRDRGYDVVTLGGKLGYDVTKDLRLSASYQRTWADLDYAQPFRVARDVNSRKEDLATIKIDYDMTDRLAFYIKGYYHNWHTDYDTDYNDLANPGKIITLYKDTPWEYDDAGVNALGRFTVLKGVEAWFGYDFQTYGGQDAVLRITPNHEDVHAVFGQLRLTPDLVKGLTLAAGFRHNEPSVGRSETIWNVSGQWNITDQLFIRGEGGTNFRLPTAEELFADDPLDERGNPALRPETSKSLNLSVGANLHVASRPVRVELTGFYRDIKNLIDYGDFDPVTEQYVFANVPGTVKVRGAEAQVDAQITDSLSATASYVYNSSKLDDGSQLDRTPRDLVKASFDWHPRSVPFGATLTINHTGRTRIGVGGTELSYGNYTVVDLSGRWYLDRARRQVINVALQNLLDQTYGRPARGCGDVVGDGPYDCSAPYFYLNRGLPLTARFSYSLAF